MEDSTTQTAVPTQSAEKFMQDVRRKTRRKFTAEEKIRVVLEGLRGEDCIAELGFHRPLSAIETMGVLL